MRLSHILGTLLCLLLVLAACGPAPAAAPDAAEAAPDTEMASEETTEDAAMESNTDTAEGEAAEAESAQEVEEEEVAEGEVTEDEDAAMESSEEMAESEMADLPAWQQIALTDVRTGETFTLADFAGKTVFVETMATWCTNCRKQLNNVADVTAQIGSDDVVFIGISVETNISAEQLAQYQQNEGFDWAFAVATPELLQTLVDTFGQTITNPPSTPHFILHSDGTYTDLTTGIESTDEILAQLNAAQG